jgi:hypothetical protein
VIPDGGVPRDVQRSRRKRAVRAKVLVRRLISRRELRIGLALWPDEGAGRPKMRGECRGHEGPCPYVACRHHLYLDVTRTGGIKLNFPDLDPWDLEQTCSLDVADRGGKVMERVGELMNLTRERVRQVEVVALRKLAAACSPELARDAPADDLPRVPVS